jgi:tetratricopeptide (TPR) repeat protein
VSRGDRSGAGRSLCALALALVVSVAGCSSRDAYVERRIAEARGLAQVRDYERAQAVLDQALSCADGDFDLLMEKGNISTRAHEFDQAALWYGRAADADPSSWKALAGRWEAELAAAPDDEAVADRVRVEADVLVEAAPDSLPNLAAAVRAYQLLGIGANEIEARLTTLFPDSELASDLIKEKLDEIGVERDDTKRLEMVDAFLKTYPVTRWRGRALRLKLVTLKRLGRCDDVLAVGRVWAAGHPEDAEILDTIAAAFVSCGVAPDEAAGLARRAVELDAASEKRENVAEYTLTAARALVLAGDFAAARTAAEEALGALRIGPDDEETGSAYHFTLGQALEGLGLDDGAFDAYLEAILVGGRQNRWPARADTALRAIFDRAFASNAKGVGLVEYARKRVGYGGPVFTDVTAAVGLEGRRESRIAWGDYDGDGYDDLLLSGRALFRNNRGAGFLDVTEAVGVGGTGANGGVWADIDNDGDLDFYATSGATEGDRTDRLWVNRGDGTFEDRTEAAGGMTDLFTTEGAAWGDIDNDGYVDLYLASYERPRTETFEDYGVGYPDLLYHNRRDGTFVEIAQAAGIVPPFGKDLSGRGVNWGDYDNDGDLDIYVSNYRLQENFLWRNDGGSFVNVAPELGVSGNETDGWWGHTIGSEWGDYDNDGDLDLFCAQLAHPRYIEVSDKSMLYRNDLEKTGVFVDRRAEARIKYAETHSDPSWGDVDADGDLDLFITSIYPDCASFLYRNRGAGVFEDITWLAGVRTMNGWGAAMSDYDNDGDLDLAVASGDGFRLFRNEGLGAHEEEAVHDWLEVRTVGTVSNAAGIGARIIVRSGSLRQIREVEGGKGTTSQHSMVAFFGLGREPGPVDVEVRFLGGGVVDLRGVDVDQRITVVEPK